MNFLDGKKTNIGAVITSLTSVLYVIGIQFGYKEEVEAIQNIFIALGSSGVLTMIFGLADKVRKRFFV